VFPPTNEEEFNLINSDESTGFVHRWLWK
jgi:hypothetical protein